MFLLSASIHPRRESGCVLEAARRPRKDDEKPRQKIAEVSPDDQKTATKAAELFNTNRTYVNQARIRSASRLNHSEQFNTFACTLLAPKQV